MRRLFAVGAPCLLLVLSLIIISATDSIQVAAQAGSATEGMLQVIDREGKPRTICPLQHTDVRAQISGSLARVTVTQKFTNPLNEKIEAVYASRSRSQPPSIT
jgi:hypothetical protein